MDNQAKITIPYLFGGAYSEDQAAFEHFVTAIEHALGVCFREDTEGRFEEQEPLVSFPLGYTIAVRVNESKNDEFEDSCTSRPAFFTLDMHTFISEYSLNILTESVDDPDFWLSEFLARYLTQKTGYTFQAQNISNELAGHYSFAVPLFTAKLTSVTDQPLTAAFRQIGESLGIPVEHILGESISQTGGQQFTAQLFGHIVTVSGQPSSNETNTITLLLQPSPDTHTFIHESGTLESTQLSIDAFLARLVSRDTGIEFTPAPRPEDVS